MEDNNEEELEEELWNSTYLFDFTRVNEYLSLYISG